MLAESHPLIRRAIRFAALPYCYFKLVNWKECSSSKIQVLNDMIYIFFALKCFPEHYSPCRLWEIDRKLWKFYYGSTYDSYQRIKLRKEVQRFEHLVLFDDKEVCELLCRGIGVDLPEYYGVINCDMDYQFTIDSILDKLNDKKVIIKPVLGQGGRNIVIAYRKNGKSYIKIGEKYVDLGFFKLKERSIIQEVITQHHELSKVSSSSVNTIRVLTLFTKSNEVAVLSASIRFGVGDSCIDNWSAGGVAVGVDKETGCLAKIAYDKKGNQFTEHPVSRVKFEGFQVPQWDAILQMAKDVQRACPFFKLLGMDIALAFDERPILIEVNPNPDTVFQEQTAGPLLADKKIHFEFQRYDLLINKYQKILYI